MKNDFILLIAMVLVSIPRMSIGAADTPDRIPILYLTDLYHPHDDPDDHYDLAMLYAIPEFDIRGIVIDIGERGVGRAGTCAIDQLNSITDHKIKYTTGLISNLDSPEDQALNQPTEVQSGVRLILDELHESETPVVVFTTGSIRDVAIAYNREPELFKTKVSRLYINAGHSSGGQEWNVDLDRQAYFRVLESDLPIYWMPCFGDNDYATYWKFTQKEVLVALSTKLQNFFIFALEKQIQDQLDPLVYLDRTPDSMVFERHVTQERNMWCTAGFLHAAGRPNSTFEFKEVPVRIDVAHGKTEIVNKGDGRIIKTFYRANQESYSQSMTASLRESLAQLGK